VARVALLPRCATSGSSSVQNADCGVGSPSLAPPPLLMRHGAGTKASGKGILHMWRNPATVVAGLGIARRPPGTLNGSKGR
jgi:hypothetical protein